MVLSKKDIKTLNELASANPNHVLHCDVYYIHKDRKFKTQYYRKLEKFKRDFLDENCIWYKVTGTGFAYFADVNISDVIRPKIKRRPCTITRLYSYLRLAQKYSNEAKSVGYNWQHGDARAYSEHDEEKDKLYSKKAEYIVEAIKYARGMNVEVFYCPIEGAIYFETKLGQVSFHYPFFKPEGKRIQVVENYKWSGLTNSEDIIENLINECIQSN